MRAHVVWNKEHYGGACFLAYPAVCQCLADSLQDDLVIFPLSVHEIVVVKLQDYGEFPITPDDIEEINNDKVAREDRLSNNIYLYSRDREELVIYMEGGLL